MCCGQSVKKRDFMSIAQVPQTLSEPSMGEFVYGTCNRRRSKIPFFDVVRNTLPLPGVRLRHTKKDVHT